MQSGLQAEARPLLPPMRQQPLPLVPVPEPSFESFHVGDNAAALAQLRGFAAALEAADHTGVPPIYLWGAAGTGKTHLLRALQQPLQAEGQAVAWFEPGVALPAAWDADWRLVIIDACERLDAVAQHVAFRLFVEAVSQGVPVAAAGRLPPVDLPLRDDLRTRLGWGNVVALQPAGDAEALAVLRAQARARGMPVPSEVLQYMLTRCTRDLGHLMQLLEALDALAIGQGRHVTVPLLRSLLADPAWASLVVPANDPTRFPAIVATAATAAATRPA